MGYTTQQEFADSYNTLFNTFSTHKTKSLQWRKWQLKQCWWLITENEDLIISSLHADIHRCTYEAMALDIAGMKEDLLYTIKNLEKWTADRSIEGSGFVFGTLGGAKIRREPLGVTLIIGAWNFPWVLLMQPLFAAIAAGCCAMLKPSEVAGATEKAIIELVPKYLDQDAIRVVTGGPAGMSPSSYPLVVWGLENTNTRI
jgi:aldehyde dehydrogenase (NAD+)